MSHFILPSHTFVGKDALEEAVPYMKQCGKKALIVTGKHIHKSPMYEALIHVLDKAKIMHNTFDGITGEPTDIMITEGVQSYLAGKCDFCIGIGGGSPLDSAKAIAAMAESKESIAAYIEKPIEGEIPKIVAIPTTAGTGSEATMFTVITDSVKGIKMLLKGSSLIPTIAVVNPDYSMDTPKSVTAATGLDALTHAIEAYTSKKASCMTDTLAISAVKRIMHYLPIAYKNGNDAKARYEMAVAALEAGICINNSSVTIVHGMSRPIGALFHVPHGMSNAMLLKECLQYALDGAFEQFAMLSREIEATARMDTDKVAAEKFISQIEKIVEICEIPSLQEYGILEEEYYEVIDKMAEDAIASGSPGNTRKQVTKEDCITIYQNLYPRS